MTPLSCWIWEFEKVGTQTHISANIPLSSRGRNVNLTEKKKSAFLRGGKIEQCLQRSLEIHPGELHNTVCRTPGLIEVGFKARLIWEAWQDCSLYRADFSQKKVEKMHT